MESGKAKDSVGHCKRPCSWPAPKAVDGSCQSSPDEPGPSNEAWGHSL